MIETVLAGPNDFQEDRYFHNTGYDEKVLSVKISPTNSLPGRKTGAIMVVEDITEKVILEKYVILSEKLVAKGEMAASIGHELNNYLTIISNNAELMDVNIRRNQVEKARENSRQVIENVGKIKRFTDGLMDFSKMETEMVRYDVRHLVENLLFSIKTQRKFKGVTIDQTFDGELPEVNIDVGQIQQVLLNLLNNAVDAMRGTEQPHINIACRFNHERQLMEISVSDNGEGMSAQIQEKVFQSHFTTKADGHGLGLSNSRKIIVNHGGEINVKSAVGQGTTFTILLPQNIEQPK
jgi:signal transduction histidine kinase